MDQSLVDTRKSKKKFSPSLVEKWLEIMYNLVWAIVLWLTLNKTTDDECLNPVWFWVHYAKYYYIVAAIFAVLRYFGLSPLLAKLSGTKNNVSVFIVLLTHSIIRVLYLGTIIGAFVAYLQRDECSSLMTVLVVQFYSTIVVIAFVGLILLCSGFALLLASTEESKKANQHNVANTFRFIFPILRYSRNANSDYL